MSSDRVEDAHTEPPPETHLNSDSSSLTEEEPLLNHRHGGRGRDYVDPDDPIVSPMNLYKIRLLRFVLVGILILNTILFVGFLLNDFISVPGFNARGQSFLSLDLVILNIFTGFVTLWWFVVPAYYERLLGYITLALVALDFIVIFTVPILRDQLGLVGNFLVLWTLLNIGLNCFADYYVEKSKQSQEIRYTGRIEKRRTVLELLVITVKILIKLLLLFLFWNISFSIWLSAFDTHEKPWGKMISVDEDNFQVHLSCYGDVLLTAKPGDEKPDDPQPILLVEGGQHTSSEEFQEWIEELYHLNKINRYCIWDRPGYGFSDSAPSPVSIGIIVDHLLEALKKEKIEGPFSLVGFDIGGLYSRVFASRNPGKIHSLLLVDSWHEDLLLHHPFSGSNKKNEDKKVFWNVLDLMDTKTGVLLWLKGVVSPLGIIRSTHWLFHPRKYSSNSRIFGHDMIHSPKYLRARLQEQVTASILSHNELISSDIHNVPLSVISSDFMIKNSLNWGSWQRALTKLSDKSIEWVVAENSNHEIWKSAKGREQLQQLLLRLVSEKSNY